MTLGEPTVYMMVMACRHYGGPGVWGGGVLVWVANLKDTVAHTTTTDSCSKGLQRGLQWVAAPISSLKDICRVGSGSDKVFTDHVLELPERDRIDI